MRLEIVATVTGTGEGGIVIVDVTASSGSAIVDAPLHLKFDPALLRFVDGTPGDFLAQDGSSVVFLADGRTRPGDVAIAVGRLDRAAGARGDGILCRVRFKELGAGESPLEIGQAMAWDATGRVVEVAVAPTRIVLK